VAGCLRLDQCLLQDNLATQIDSAHDKLARVRKKQAADAERALEAVMAQAAARAAEARGVEALALATAAAASGRQPAGTHLQLGAGRAACCAATVSCYIVLHSRHQRCYRRQQFHRTPHVLDGVAGHDAASQGLVA
jgi:hypothetical protein